MRTKNIRNVTLSLFLFRDIDNMDLHKMCKKNIILLQGVKNRMKKRIHFYAACSDYDCFYGSWL